MATITFKGRFENWEVWKNLVTSMDENEGDFINIKIDDAVRQIIVKLHKSEFAKIQKAVSSQLEPPVVPNEVVAGGNLQEKLAKYLISIMWTGAEVGIGNSSLRNMTAEQYYQLNKKDWDNKAKTLIEIIEASQREA